MHIAVTVFPMYEFVSGMTIPVPVIVRKRVLALRLRPQPAIKLTFTRFKQRLKDSQVKPLRNSAFARNGPGCSVLGLENNIGRKGESAFLKFHDRSRSVRHHLASHTASLSCLLPLMREHWFHKHNVSHIMICMLGCTRPYPPSCRNNSSQDV